MPWLMPKLNRMPRTRMLIVDYQWPSYSDKRLKKQKKLSTTLLARVHRTVMSKIERHD
jgi:hypothetical protein